jgi:putative membrane protein
MAERWRNDALRLLAHVVANAVALLATTVVPGISFTGGWITLLVAGAILGVFNAIVRPVAFFFSLPALILTLGLFYFVLNGILLWLAALVIPGYHVAGFVPAILGGIVVGIVHWAIQALFGRRAERKE